MAVYFLMYVASVVQGVALEYLFIFGELNMNGFFINHTDNEHQI